MSFVVHDGVTLQIWYDCISKNPDFTSGSGFTTPLNRNRTVVNPELRSSSGFSQVPRTGPRVWFGVLPTEAKNWTELNFSSTTQSTWPYKMQHTKLFSFSNYSTAYKCSPLAPPLYSAIMTLPLDSPRTMCGTPTPSIYRSNTIMYASKSSLVNWQCNVSAQKTTLLTYSLNPLATPTSFISITI